MATLALMTTACGDKKSKEQADGEKEGVEVKNEGKAEEPAWQTYENAKYGYSIEVPADMTKRETMTEDDGTIYSYDGDEGVTFNRIDISGGRQIFDEEYTPELVQKDFENWTDNMEVDSKECHDTWYSYTIKGELFTEMHRHIFKGTKKCLVMVCYDADHEAELGGEVAEHIFSSVKFK